MCLLPVFVLVPCLYYCTVSTANVRFTRLYSCRAVVVPLHSVYCACTFYPFLYSCRACTIAQSARVLYVLPVLYSCRACTIAQAARVMYVLPVLYSCRAVAVPLHRVLYSRRALTIAQSARVVYVLPVLYSCVFVPCVYYCTVGTGNVRFTRFVLVPCVYYCTGSPGNARFTRFVLVPCCGCTIAPRLYSRRVFTIAQSARVMYVLHVLYLCRAVAVPLHRM